MGEFSVEKFFLERELNQGPQRPDSPEEFWDLLHGDRIDSYRREGWGLYFRGQSNAARGLTSSLYRVAKDALVEREERDAGSGGAHESLVEPAMVAAEKAIIAAARDNGLGRHMDDLELLCLLQHYLMPTRLIDVTAGPAASIYFACSANMDLDGRVFLISTREAENTIATDSRGRLPWHEWIKWGRDRDRWSARVAPISARDLHPSIRAQEGRFLAGGLWSGGGRQPMFTYDRPEGSVETLNIETMNDRVARDVSTLTIYFPHADRKARVPSKRSWSAYGWSVRIPQDWKRDLLAICAEHGVTRESMKPPIGEVQRLIDRVAADAAATRLAETLR
ncbi:MAG: FRG domain-containing protein [Solirubrobacterales bacterium]|nr:FRG domain-containing protein [Solirubrobacterales bacterium]